MDDRTWERFLDGEFKKWQAMAAMPEPADSLQGQLYCTIGKDTLNYFRDAAVAGYTDSEIMAAWLHFVCFLTSWNMWFIYGPQISNNEITNHYAQAFAALVMENNAVTLNSARQAGALSDGSTDDERAI